MPGVVTLPSGVMAGGPATKFVGSNTQVQSQLGYLGLQTDLVMFSGPGIKGVWATASAHVSVNGVPIVTETSQGQATTIPGPTVPMTVAMADPRVSAS